MNINKYNYAMIAIALSIASCSEQADEPVIQDEPEVIVNWDTSEDAPALPTVKNIEIGASEANALSVFETFSFKLNTLVAENYNDVIIDGEENYCLSPLSMISCLSLVSNSVDDPAAAQIARTLGCNSVESMNTLNTKLLQFLPAKENGVDMRLSNSVWYSDLYSVTTEFRDKMAKQFGASVYARDFDSEKTIDDINTWASYHTKGMINNIIQHIPANILWLNAVYFEGEWESKFDASLTKAEKFYGTLRTSNVNMMHRTAIMTYASDDKLQMLSIPFKGEEYRLSILLPVDQKQPVSELVTLDRFKTLSRQLRGCDVTLSLPKFKAETKSTLNKVLDMMGMPYSNLTLTGIGFPASYITNLATTSQAAKFEIDEEGAKAAAVTIIMDSSTGITPEYDKVTMNVNRPFMYIITSRTTGAVVMMGRVNNL